MRLLSLLALLSISVSLSSCTAPQASESPLPSADAETVGMSQERLNLIAPAMQKFVDEGSVAGIVSLVAKNGHIVHWESVGFSNIADHEPMDDNMIVQICSMTKPITSTAVMMLVERGVVELDAPVSTYLPVFSESTVYTESGPIAVDNPITVADLLSHTSGLTYGFFGNTPTDSLYRAADLASADLEHLVTTIAQIPLVAHPGQQWTYSFSTDVLGYLIESVTGIPFDEFLQTEILDPLGMVDSSFFVPSDKRERYATNYSVSEDGSLQENLGSGCGNHESRPQLLSGGAGLNSTAADYVRFTQMLLNGGVLEGTRILQTETVDLMRTNRLSDNLIADLSYPGYGFGLGFAVMTDASKTERKDTNGIFRWTGYSNTGFWVDPENELIGIVLSQLTPSGTSMRSDFQTLVYEALEN